jgi:4-amino-4-deoxy-L-arabinose transferase-like glycosyltransferase
MIEGASPAGALAARLGVSPRRFLAMLDGRRAMSTALLLWLVVVTSRGLELVAQTLNQPRWIYIWPDIATPQILGSAVFVYLFCLTVVVLARWRWPAATLPISAATGILVVVADALVTGSLGALLVVLVFGILAVMLGHALLRRLPAPPLPLLVRVPLALALGLGLLGLLLFGFGSIGALNAPAVLACGGLLVLGLAVNARRHWTATPPSLRAWRPSIPSWFESLVVGLTTGIVTFAVLVALVPETSTDAVGAHLPIAREIWQTGTVAEFASHLVSKDPIQAQVLYAVAYGLGGMIAPKLLYMLVGLAGIAGVAALGWLVAGRVAAVVGGAVFATMPLTLWLIGHAFTDLFSILFTVTALLSLLLWQRSGGWGWLLVAGMLAGFGLAVKLNMALTIAALAGAILLVGTRPGHWRERILSVLVFAIGTLVMFPWLLRAFIINGTLSPKVDVVVDNIAAILNRGSVTVEQVATPTVVNPLRVYDPQAFALGHSPLDLLRIPWFFTFHADEHRFLVIGRGEIGVLLLLLLPLVLLAPRSRALALVAMTGGLSYVAWALSPFQIIRHLLPVFALAAVLAGIGVAAVVDGRRTSPQRMLVGATQGSVLLGLLAAPIFFLSGVLTQIPVDFLLGRESAEAYVERVVPASAALATASTLPPDTLVGYFGFEHGAGVLYTEARLIFVEPNRSLASLGTTPEEVLASLDRLGVHYFIWNRASTNPSDLSARLLSVAFLRDHTRILGGDRNAYLFEVRPGAGEGWGVPNQNLLEDPGLRKARKSDGPWTTIGNVEAKRGVVSLLDGGSLAQRVAVSGEGPYLLMARTKCSTPTADVALGLRWFDDRGVELSAEWERVVPGVAPSEQFLWRQGPRSAASVSAELSGFGCEFDDAALYRLS